LKITPLNAHIPPFENPREGKMFDLLKKKILLRKKWAKKC